MPHLSPMNWIMSIMIFWASMSLLATTFWWSEHHLFNSSMSTHTLNTPNTWNWMLQDGWD